MPLKMPTFLSRFAGRAAKVPLRGGSVWVRARYDGAMTTDENRKHWSNADFLSADAANNPAARRMLRIRTRYEVANNCYARGITLTLADDVVGTGPRLQMSTGDESTDAALEASWRAWSRAVGMPEKLRTMKLAKTGDGETFALMSPNIGIPHAVKLDFKLVESDQVSSPFLNFWGEPGKIDGIIFDDFGNPIEYHVLKRHPGSMYGLATLEYTKVPASSVIHWFRQDRPGQHRGIPELTPALALFAQLRRYTLAVLQAAETAAQVAGVLESTAAAAESDKAPEPLSVAELERNTIMTMPDGWKLSQLKSEQPTTTYKEFKAELINEIARCLNMPYNIAACNSSGYNYSSGRLDHQTYDRSISIERDHCERVVLDRLLSEWLKEAALITDLVPPKFRPAFSRGELPSHCWFWDERLHVDPEKEALATSVELNNGMTNLADVYAEKGEDWREKLELAATVKAEMDRLGLSFVANPPNPGARDAAKADE